MRSTRDDYPDTDPALGKVNVVVSRRDGELHTSLEERPPMPDELVKLLEAE